MNARSAFRIAALILVLGAVTSSARAATPPWAKIMTTDRVEADPAKTYPLKEENGPWMIMACSFSGEGAEKQANDLALEIRTRYKMEAYVHKVHFKLDDPNAPGASQSSAARWQYRRFRDHPDLYKDGAIKEIAVLVGNYSAVDDPDGQKALQKIKLFTPDCLDIDKGKSSSRTLAVLRYFQQQYKREVLKTEDQKKGPMGHAFITTNPLLPSDYYAPKGGVDELVLRMNKGVTHSLLDCPGKYTVQVAHFTGSVIIDQKEIREIENGKSVKSGLIEAAKQAHILAEALRIKGYEAYEFHDRYASIVTVGSFDNVGTPRADGKIEINPRVHAIMKTFGSQPSDKSTASVGAGAITVKSVAGVPLDFQPIPVEVPKRSISRELARRLTDQ